MQGQTTKLSKNPHNLRECGSRTKRSLSGNIGGLKVYRCPQSLALNEENQPRNRQHYEVVGEEF